MKQVYQMLGPGQNLKNSPSCFNDLSHKFYRGGGAKSTKLHCTVWPWSPLSHRLFEMRQFIYLKSKTNPMPSTNLCLATFPNSVHFTLRTTCEKLAIFSLEMQLWCEQRTK